MKFHPSFLQPIYQSHKSQFQPPPEIQAYIDLTPREDVLLWNQWTPELQKRWGQPDKYGIPVPYGLGPSSIKFIRLICEIVQPISILEIGLNMGYSSAMWLNLSAASVFSIDISDRDETIHGGETLKRLYPDRFDYLICDSKLVHDKLSDKHFDTIFIDGGHDLPDVESDIQLGIQLGIKKFVFDDWWPNFGPGVQKAIAKNKIKITDIFCNIAIGEIS